MALRRPHHSRLQGCLRGVRVIARLTVSRKSPEDEGSREIFVSLDGEEIAILREGESATREIAAGHHQIRAHNTLFRKALDFDVAADDDARFVVINKAGWGTYTMMMLLGAGPLYLTLARED